MADFLILDRDKGFARELAGALLPCGNHALTETTMMREACLILARKPQDLAFVSADEGAGAIASLRRLQPELPIILTVPETGSPIPRVLSEIVQGILQKERVQQRVCGLVRRVLEENNAAPTIPERGRFDKPHLRSGISARLDMALDESSILAVLLTSAGQILAGAGELNDEQVRGLADRVQRRWAGGSELSVQLQFARLPGREGDLLLYTRAIGERDQLSLVVLQDSPLPLVREEADRLAGHLAAAYDPALIKELDDPTMLLGEAMSEEVTPRANCYALLWRPIAEIPSVLRLPLRRSLARVASMNACVLTYAEVTAEYVHIVVECPPQRNSAWGALLFKQSTEQEIQQRFGIRIALWEGGYLATASCEPFGPDVLSQYIDESASQK